MEPGFSDDWSQEPRSVSVWALGVFVRICAAAASTCKSVFVIHVVHPKREDLTFQNTPAIGKMPRPSGPPARLGGMLSWLDLLLLQECVRALVGPSSCPSRVRGMASWLDMLSLQEHVQALVGLSGVLQGLPANNGR